MQIHEITRGNNRRQTQLDEGLWDTIKGAAKDFAGSKWLNSQTLAQSQEASKLAKQSKQYVDFLTKKWMTEGPNLLTQTFQDKYGEKLASGDEITPEEEAQTFREVFSRWSKNALKTKVGNVPLTLDDVLKNVPGAATELPRLLNTATKSQDQSSIHNYLAQALTGLQTLSKQTRDLLKAEEEEEDSTSGRSYDDLKSGKGKTRSFNYEDEDGKVKKITVDKNQYYQRDSDSGKLIKIEDEDEIEKIADQDPKTTRDDNGEPSVQKNEVSDQEVEENTPPEDSAVAQVKSKEELEDSAKKVATDKSTEPNVPESKHDYRVISFTPSLIIRYKNQEFMMDDENYPQRDWYKLPNGTPVKNEPLIRLLNNFATEAFDEQDIMSAHGEPESDIDVGASENAGVRVEPGTKLRLLDPRNNGVYYKDALGNWSTEEGRRLKKPETLKYLEKKVKTDGQSRVEKVLPPTPEEKKKGATA